MPDPPEKKPALLIPVPADAGGDLAAAAKPLPAVLQAAPHLLTATVNHWLPLFTRSETVNIVLDSWRFLQREAGLVIYGYVILENHLHLVELDYMGVSHQTNGKAY